MEISAPELRASLSDALESKKGTSRKHETHFCARLGDRTEVVDQVGFGHTNTGITNREDLVLLVRGDADVKLLARVEDGGIGQRCIPNFVKRIGVRD